MISWPACMEREPTTENISSLLCQTPAHPITPFPSINLSCLCFYPHPLPLYSPSAFLPVKLYQCMHFIKTHIHSFRQPGTDVFDCTKSTCALKAPVRQDVREKTFYLRANLFYNKPASLGQISQLATA